MLLKYNISLNELCEISNSFQIMPYKTKTLVCGVEVLSMLQKQHGEEDQICRGSARSA